MHPVEPRRTSLSKSIAPLRVGSNLGGGGGFRGIDSTLAAHLRATDQTAAAALRRLGTSSALLNGREEWCLCLVEMSPAEALRSPFVRERLDLIQQRRRNATPPGLFDTIRQPTTRFRAVPLRYPRRLPWLLVYELGPDVIIDASVAAIDEEGSTTAGVIMSRPYRVWVDVLGKPDAPQSVVTITGVHNTFPLPELNDEQFEAIGIAADAVLMACRFAMTESIIEIYERDQLPDTVQAAHDRLDAIVCDVFGIPPDATDDQIAGRLLDLYRDLSAAV